MPQQSTTPPEGPVYALSPSQEIVWLHEQLLPGSRAYNSTAAIELRGELDVRALLDSWEEVLRRHPGLRLELVDREGGLPGQRVSANSVPRFREVDLSAAEDPEAEFAALVRSEADTPLDTYAAPLVRWCLVRMGPDHHRLVHVEHHLVHDGRSWVIALRDLFTLYRCRLLGTEPVLPRPRGYQEHLQESARTADLAKSLQYWQEELRGAAHEIALPGLGRPGAERRHHGAQLRQALDRRLVERLHDHCATSGHTAFTTLLTLFAELLRRHSGRDDLVVGTATANRGPGWEESVGMFVNTIPLRLRPDPAGPADEAVDEVTDVLMRGLPHQEVPVQELTKALGLHTDGARNPMFNVMFNAHDTPLPVIDVPGLEVSLDEAFTAGTTRSFDLDVVLIPHERTIGADGSRPGSGMTAVWDYDADVFPEESIRLLAARFEELLESYLARPGARLASLAADSTAAAVAAAAGSRAVGSADPSDDRVAALDPSRRDGTATALVSGALTWTYADLDREVTALADRLTRAGVTAGRPVAVVLPRGAGSVVALLACLRTGAVYAPLSPDDPRDRLALLLDRLRPALVLATADSALGLPVQGPPVGLLDTAEFPAAAPGRSVEDAAYVIHTSGSTGTPKPVAVPRRALDTYLAGMGERLALTAADRVLVFARPSFDQNLEDVLVTLAAGAALVLPQREVPTADELVAVLAGRRVTVANLPASYFLSVRGELAAARRDGRWQPTTVVVGGERLPVDALADWAHPGTRLLNAYGVTEATVTSVTHTVTADDLVRGGDTPLGTEIDGTRVLVLDTGLDPLPDGAVGELAIAGGTLATGYLDDERTTAERFVTLPALGGRRVYRTGDRGYRDPAGRIHFLGRRDNQVKLRGHRIEPEEIEAVASAELGGRSCAVVLHDDPVAGPVLTGFVATDGPLDERALHRALAGRLPAPFLPARWIARASLPTLPGGKPDRARLAALAATAAPAGPAAQATGTGTGPGTQDGTGFTGPGESLLAEGWRAVLGHDRFTADSHFFQVGGHSLLAAQLVAWLEPRLGHRPPLRTVFRNPILADQARALEVAA
ncbi:amino acid adenylation domain-containing protein [Kitasatospora sp. NPDC001547]|uniref:non-ribosomal peptide synthetase n=1 Tax=Kitasatospora sp. NPDC001547 TaxID=3364015 RepID=UPI0036C8186A